jgi:hydrogenase/urease accessory protein HupE
LADRSRPLGLFLVAAAAAPAPAWAHASLEAVPTFWSGALHVLVTPLAVATIIGLGAALVRASDRATVTGIAAAAGAAAAVGWLALPLPAGPAAAGAAVVGLAAALAGRLPLAAAALLGLLAGATAGTSAGSQTQAVAPALGAAFAAALICVAIVEIAARLPRTLQLAPRILGAWVAAIGLLMGALALRAGAPLVTSVSGGMPWSSAFRSVL